ncbi:MAG: hypothetical protein FJZ43_03860 [Candidatus Staskawiczbacteria bacterium]|nr:hypothetical protein [Candidatus Staskawiczbacteria bacterium]
MNPATQDFLEIEDIRDGVLILKNNQIRGVLMVSSINFALKATEEQDSIIYGFQSFLNSLGFSCQILIQSRHINVTPYLDAVKKLEEKQTNELLKLQTSSYIEFIKELVKGENVMTKNFLVVVPYNLAEILGVGASLKKSALFDSKNKGAINEENFEKCKNQLWQRMDFVASGLRRCELDAVSLTTPELAELFWAIYHPSEAEVGYYPQIMPDLLK